MDRRSSICSVASLEIDFSDEFNWNLLPDSLRTESFQTLNSSLVQDDADDAKDTESASASLSANKLQQQHPPRVIPVASSNSRGTLPDHNKEYGEMSYWDDRFAIEDEYEWLVSYSDVASQLGSHIHTTDRILVVGCGNSKFSYDLYQTGFTNICNIDYSQTVIDGMKRKYQELCPTMDWMVRDWRERVSSSTVDIFISLILPFFVALYFQVMDMTNMSDFANQSFDVVLDKAAMDALMVQEGDVWNPRQTVIDQARSMCQHISRILKPNGKFLQISFAQPHFRKKYLLGQHASNSNDDENDHQQANATTTTTTREDASDEFQWTFQVEKIAEKGCFENFLYVMTRLGSTA
jgi:SAM-dependent methyltransferase